MRVPYLMFVAVVGQDEADASQLKVSPAWLVAKVLRLGFAPGVSGPALATGGAAEVGSLRAVITPLVTAITRGRIHLRSRLLAPVRPSVSPDGTPARR